MIERTLVEVAFALVGRGKGILPMDESHGTCDERFAAAGIPQTEEARRNYRGFLKITPQLGDCSSGAILYDETICQQMCDGTAFTDVLISREIIPGIKVDIGATARAGQPEEKVTEGLDGLRARYSAAMEVEAELDTAS